MGFLVSIVTVGINSKSFPWRVHAVQEISPNFLRCPKRVDNMADNADMSQSQAASHHRLLSHATLAHRMREVYGLCADSQAL